MKQKFMAATLGLGLGFSSVACATGGHGARASDDADRLGTPHHFWIEPTMEDTLSVKIKGWQDRQSDAAYQAQDGFDTRLYRAYQEYRDRNFPLAGQADVGAARDIARFVQGLSTRHYTPDSVQDFWPTLPETFARGAEDCDGLELLTRQLMLEAGFPEEEIFRGIIRNQQGGYHMVTLWFQDKNDPWVIDPTGVAYRHVPKSSQMKDWRIIRYFNDGDEFFVAGLGAGGQIRAPLSLAGESAPELMAGRHLAGKATPRPFIQ